MIFGENLYLPSKLRNKATQTWVDNAISSLLNKCIRYMSIKVIIPELKRRAVGRDDAGQRRYPRRRTISTFILFLSNVTASRE